MSAAPNYQGVCLPDGSGERLNGIQEVVGSIPIISTTAKGTTLVVPFLFLQGPSGLETVWPGDAGSYRKKVLDNPGKV